MLLTSTQFRKAINYYRQPHTKTNNKLFAYLSKVKHYSCIAGPHQQAGFNDFVATKTNFSTKLYVLAQSRHASVIKNFCKIFYFIQKKPISDESCFCVYLQNLTHWQQEVEKHMVPFLQSVKDLYKQEKTDLSQTSLSTQWNNTWSAMFYCGTVFTTIGKWTYIQMILLLQFERINRFRVEGLERLVSLPSKNLFTTQAIILECY